MRGNGDIVVIAVIACGMLLFSAVRDYVASCGHFSEARTRTLRLTRPEVRVAPFWLN